MSMKTVIREKRKEIGLTQEQVAASLGVSTPAVNKWENGSTYPDITLLPVLARLLKIDVNTLFCFNEGLSEQEVQGFCKEVTETIRQDGFESGFTMGIDKIREYPNCAKLIYSTALVLDGALLMSGMNGDDKKEFKSQITALYERVAKSDEDQIRIAAVYILAARYTDSGDYDKAQEMIQLLPEAAFDKRQLQANLFLKQDQPSEAAKILESKLLMMGMTDIQVLLISLADIAVKEGNDQDASRLAEISRELNQLLGLWDYYSFVVPLHIALGQENVEDSISLMKSMLAATREPWEMKGNPLYRHLAAKTQSGSTGKAMLPGLLSMFETDSKFAFLHSNADFQQLIGQYRALC